MAARRKPLEMVSPISSNLDTTGLSELEQRAIEKDRCLLEAAFASDGVIVTRDDAFRVALSKTPQGANLLKKITWINPVTDGVAALEEL